MKKRLPDYKRIWPPAPKPSRPKKLQPVRLAYIYKSVPVSYLGDELFQVKLGLVE